MNRHTLLAAALVATGALLPLHAQAQDQWFVRVGVHNVDPQSDTGTLAGGTLASSIDSALRPTFSLGYQLNPHVAFELLAALPFKHTVSLNGAEAVDFKHLPPTASVQYYFAPESRVNPFLGLGLNYTWTYDEASRGPLAGTDVRVGNSWGLAAQAGLVFRTSRNFDVIADVRWMDIGADVRVNGASVGTVHVDPLVYGVALGWRF